MKEIWGRIRAAFENLAPRERALVSAAGGMLALSLVYVAVVMPALAWGARADQRLGAAQQQPDAMQRLRSEYDDVNARLSAVEKRIPRGASGSLRTKLENLAQRSSVKVESMEPQSSPANDSYKETKVEVALKSVSLEQAVTYLTGIESAPQVLSVKSLRIRKRAEKNALLDVTFTVSSFEPL